MSPRLKSIFKSSVFKWTGWTCLSRSQRPLYPVALVLCTLYSMSAKLIHGAKYIFFKIHDLITYEEKQTKQRQSCIRVIFGDTCFSPERNLCRCSFTVQPRCLIVGSRFDCEKGKQRFCEPALLLNGSAE